MLDNELTNIEMMVMKCIWDKPDEMALSDIVEMINRRYHKDWRPQTISTYLASLVRKGYLSMSRHGRVFIYHPEVCQEEFKKKRIEKLVEYLGFASPKEFFASMCTFARLDDLTVENI